MVEEEYQPDRGAVIGSPYNVVIHVPRNRVDEHGVKLQKFKREVDRDTLLAGLNHTSDYIAQREQNMTAIAIGGAVNTLYLESRNSTHDVDLFGSREILGNKERMLLDEASHDAQQHIAELGTDWINTETQIWMPEPILDDLTEAAVEQNVVVFKGDGLTVYAAPWHFAFSAKINRLVTRGRYSRSYDLDDAVTYLHEYICSHGNEAVEMSTVLGWAAKYYHMPDEDFLRDRVDPEYQRRYDGCHAFV